MSTVTIYYNTEVMAAHVPPRGGLAVEEPERIVGIEAFLKGHPVSSALAAWKATGSLDIPTCAGSLWSQCDIVKVEESITDAAVEAEYGAKAVRNARYKTPYRGSKLDPACGDIYWSAGTWEAAKTAASAAIQAAVRVLTGQTNNHSHAFCIVRPPGHHCFDVPAGFCILNNVVIAAKEALKAGKRVAILDWDYHFGDGTAAALWGEERVMFVSMHAERTRSGFPTYPARTARNFKGVGLREATRGRCFNVQWTEDDANDAACAYAMRTVIMPALQHFAPDLLLISAGYDATEGDSLAGMKMVATTFGHMAAALTRVGCPIVAVLEGGYDVHLLADGVAQTIRGLQQAPVYMRDLDKWLVQEPQEHHREVVDEVAGYVLGAGHNLED